MINVLVPMAGEGSRFATAGYKKPKPFIDVLGKPMITRVLDNLNMPGARFILICRKSHVELEEYLLSNIRQEYAADIVVLESLTEGTACTILSAHSLINNETPLLVANSDQLVDIQMTDFVDDAVRRSLDGSILTFEDKTRDPKWSFAKTDEDGFVEEVREKEAISNRATVGIYLFSQGKYFVDGAIDMIVKNDRVNGEFYTCPVYNYLIDEEKRIGIYDIDRRSMHGLGTPTDLQAYEKTFSVSD